MRNKVEHALESAGLTMDHIASHSEQVILFGSCAAGCDTRDSDVDLLCVGDGKRTDTGRLHLLWISPSSLSDPDWLGSEIGGHVSEYGIWLKGKRTLGPPQKPSSRTLQKKRNRIIDRASVLKQKWPLLSQGFKKDQLRSLRLDLQRYEMLNNFAPVAPNPMLDERWTQQRNRKEWLKTLVGSDTELSSALRGVASKASSSWPFR
jgi:hypothetical protein